MALLSPGVQVSVIDQSNYTPAAAGSVPFILIATAQNKVSGAGTGIAPGTLAANANKLYVMTSQRDLLSTFGVPFFYNTTGGTPINGYELNEYGLLAAYSALGVTNTAYVMRADIDLAALTASLTRPTGAPANGTYWLDTTNSTWGITQWNQTTSTFVAETPIVITNASQLYDNTTIPLNTIGSIGDYAVVAQNINNPIYYKRGGPSNDTTQAPNWNQDGMSASDLYNSWVLVGSDEWKTAWPTVQGVNSPATLTPGDQIEINGTVITVASSPDNTVTYLAGQINSALNSEGVYAANLGGKLSLYAEGKASGDNITVTGATGNGTRAILNFASQTPAPYKVGDTILVSGITPAGYNGTQVVTACTTTSVTFSSTVTDSYVSGGSIKYVPASGFTTGAIYVTNALNTPLATLGITAGEYYSPQYQHGPNYVAPRWRTTDTRPAPTGSVFQQTNVVNNGMLLEVKKYNSTLGTFVLQSCPVYANDSEALYTLDPAGGGTNIPAGTTFAQPDPYDNANAGLVIYERLATGPTLITGSIANPNFVSGSTFSIQATQPGTTTLTSIATVSVNGTTTADFVNAVSGANVPYVSAQVNSAGQIVFEHSAGGDIYLTDGANSPVAAAGFTTSTTGVRTRYLAGAQAGLTLSNWVGSPTFTYTASSTAPDVNPANGTYWYFSDSTQADIMIQNNGAWVGYQNCLNDVRGYNLSVTNPTGPIFSATAPTTQNDPSESALQPGDLWIDTSPAGLENYPVISRWQNVSGQNQWVQVDNTDHTTINGIVFADARWSINGSADPITDPLPPIATGSTPLIRSNWTDPDVPNPKLYSQGTLLWNTRRSGFNVKSFEANAWNTTDYPPPAVLPTNPNTWNTASANRDNGAPNMGRHAQRYLIVKALRASIDTNTQIRENQATFNLVACPSYPELAPNMRLLNNDRGDVGFNVVDTPLRLTPDEVTAWANNTGIYSDYGITTNLSNLYTEGNLAAGDSYSATFYPSCTTTDLSGNTVVTAPSHMMLRTIIRSDAVAYPWFAPAGLRRGVVDNALTIGYLNPSTGGFQILGVNQGLRDVLYQNDINPITFIPGTGIVNFGNHTLQGTNTALDRINVARLVAYLRGRLEIIGNQYLFEPNDTITRSSIQTQITSLMVDLVGKRAIYDYLVVCDLTNNTPSTIDANELYVDIAIEPVKAVEFIYIPMRIQNTGTIQAQAVA